MNKENDEINIENELNELPGYIQSIINDCYTFDKKENPNKNEDSNNFYSDIENKNINIDNTPTDQEKINLDNSISKTNENTNDNNKEDNIDENYKDFYDDKENDINIENIFNYKNDFFNPKKSDKEDLESKKNNNNKKDESKDDINNNNNSDPKESSCENNSGIKLYYIQENNLLNIKRSLRLQSILQNNIPEYQNNTFECSICFRRIQNYGLLSNCDDVFCYDCIKQWRSEAISKNKREMFRRCPICNCESPMLIKSKNYVSGEEKRKKFYELKQEKKISQVNQ